MLVVVVVEYEGRTRNGRENRSGRVERRPMVMHVVNFSSGRRVLSSSDWSDSNTFPRHSPHRPCGGLVGGGKGDVLNIESLRWIRSQDAGSHPCLASLPAQVAYLEAVDVVPEIDLGVILDAADVHGRVVRHADTCGANACTNPVPLPPAPPRAHTYRP